MSTDTCDQDVYENGVFVGLFADMTKDEAEALCAQMTEKTGRKHDWHYFGGRIRVLALNPKSEAELAAEGLAPWLSAALDDPNVCVEYKQAIGRWFNAGMPTPKHGLQTRGPHESEKEPQHHTALAPRAEG